MSSSVTINRGEKVSIPFSIPDPNNGLLGVRVSWSAAPAAGASPVLKKASAVGASSADVTVVLQAGLATGTINLLPADYASLPADSYVTTLWVDTGAGDDRCASAGGSDTLNINRDVSRT